MVEIGRRVGLPTRAVLTAMDAPLGQAVGNALEVIESLEVLKGRGPADVTELSVVLASQMLVVAGIAADESSARARVADVIANGAALEKFRAVVARQGGDPAVVDDYSRLASTSAREDVTAPRGGFVVGIDAECIGRASMLLGAGRERLDTPIDYGAGILLRAGVGESVEAGQALAQLCIGRHARLEEARALAASAFVLGDAPSPRRPLVHEVVG
jgi:thymidine phosphorylase